MAENDAHYNGTFDGNPSMNNSGMWPDGSYDMSAPDGNGIDMFSAFFKSSTLITGGATMPAGQENDSTMPAPEQNHGGAASFSESGNYNNAAAFPESDNNGSLNGTGTLPESDNTGKVTLPETDNSSGTVTFPESNNSSGAVTLPESNNNSGAVTLPELDNNSGAVTLPEPGEGNMGGPGPVLMPGYPLYPDLSPQYYGQVRFLNASTNSFTVNISVDNTAYAINSRFGTITNYDWITDGFHTVTVRRGTGARSILLQQNFPFVGGQKVTMVLTDSATGGLDMIRVVDTGCSNMPYNTGCYRFANMAYSGSSFDLLLYGGETVFRNVGFETVTPYKQAMAGTYQFYVTNSNTYNTFLRELPVIVIGAIGTNTAIRQPLVSFQTDILAGQNYTTYMLGNIWSDTGLIAMTVED